MMNYVYGAISMWLVLGVIYKAMTYTVLDLFDYQEALFNVLFFPITLLFVFADLILTFLTTTWVAIRNLDLIIKYNVNPYFTSVSKLRKMSLEDKEKFCSRTGEKNKKYWRKALDI